MIIDDTLKILSIAIRRKSWSDPQASIVYTGKYWWPNDNFRALFQNEISHGYCFTTIESFIKPQLTENDWEVYDKPVTATAIINMLGCDNKSPVAAKKGLFSAPNISFGFFVWGEADYIQISKTMHLTEVEVKVSYADFKKDKVKSKFTDVKKFTAWKSQIKNFYYAAPSKLADRILAEADASYGVISAGYDCFGNPEVKVLRKAGNNDDAKPISQEDLMKLVRLLSFRLFKHGLQ